jgi:hypothetical protein
VCGALLYYDLGEIADFAGLTDFLLLPLVFCLHIVAKQLIPKPTDFDLGDSLWISWFSIAFCLALFVILMTDKVLEMTAF